METINISRNFNNTVFPNVDENREHFDQRLYYTMAVSIAVNALLSFTALVGNVAILITLWKTPSLHSPANILLASLAVSDLAVGLLAQPLFLTAIIKRNPTLGVIFITVTMFLCSASFYTTTAIGVDRLLALQLHLRYEVVVTPFRVAGIVTFIWVFSALYSGAWLLISRLFYFALSPTALAFLVVNFCVYLKIYLIVRRHQLQIAHQEQQHQGHIFWRLKKSAVNTFLIYIVLLVCYTPYSSVTIFIYNEGGYSPSFANVSVITGTIMCLNSSLNPMLYSWRVREIRTAMRHHFCC